VNFTHGANTATLEAFWEHWMSQGSERSKGYLFVIIKWRCFVIFLEGHTEYFSKQHSILS